MITLKEQLNKKKTESFNDLPDDILKEMDKGNEALLDLGIEENALAVGQEIPEFLLANAKNEFISSEDLLRQGALVISFYRGYWCPYCNLELRALQQIIPEIRKLNAQLVAISPQLPDKSLSMAEKYDLKFEVLSDINNKVAKTFGLVFTLPENLREVYSKNFGIDIPAHNGDISYELPVPATYVVDQKGIIYKAFVDTDYRNRMNPEEIIDALKSGSAIYK